MWYCIFTHRFIIFAMSVIGLVWGISASTAWADNPVDVQITAGSVTVSSSDIRALRLLFRVGGPGGFTDERRSDSGSLIWQLPSNASDGRYRYDVYVVGAAESESENDILNYHIAGRFTVSAGRLVLPLTTGGLIRQIMAAVMYVVDFVLPQAEAADQFATSNIPTVFFDDVDNNTPAWGDNDWQIQITDANSSSSGRFRLMELATNKVLLRGEPGFPDHAFVATPDYLSLAGDFYVVLNGLDPDDVGINTSNPQKTLHILGATNTGIRLEDSGSTQVWDILQLLGNLSFFNTSDGIEALTLSKGNSRVGMGAANPQAPLHVRRTIDGATELFRFTNDGGSFITWEKTGSSAKWFFTHENAAQGRFIIDHQFNGVPNGPEFALSTSGDLEIKGSLSEMSDVNAKLDIIEMDGESVLKKLESLPVYHWRYRADPYGRHIGPMAQDFHAVFGLGNNPKRISPRDMAGVALSAVKAIQQQIRYRQKQIDAGQQTISRQNEVIERQQKKLHDQRGRLAGLESQARHYTTDSMQIKSTAVTGPENSGLTTKILMKIHWLLDSLGPLVHAADITASGQARLFLDDTDNNTPPWGDDIDWALQWVGLECDGGGGGIAQGFIIYETMNNNQLLCGENIYQSPGVFGNFVADSNVVRLSEFKVVHNDGAVAEVAINVLGSPVPAVGEDLHVADTTSPGIRIEDATAAQSWDIEENNGNLRFYDVTGNTEVLTLAAGTGNVGIGVADPLAPLHIVRASAMPAEMFRFTNNGGSYITWEKTDTNAKWFFSHENAAQGRFIIDHQFNDAANGPEFALTTSGGLEIKGMITELSDRDAKHDIREPDATYILNTLEHLKLAEWRYKADPHNRHAGPMAQDFHALFGYGARETHISARDIASVALAAIRAQTDILDAQERTIDQQGRMLKAQAIRINAQREELLSQDLRLDQLETQYNHQAATEQSLTSGPVGSWPARLFMSVVIPLLDRYVTSANAANLTASDSDPEVFFDYDFNNPAPWGNVDWRITPGAPTESGSALFSLRENREGNTLLNAQGTWPTEAFRADADAISLASDFFVKHNAMATARVGINTSNPQSHLHILHSFSPGIRIENRTSGQSWDIDELLGDEIRLQDVTGNLGVMQLRTNGNVGIGPFLGLSNVPEAPLHIQRAQGAAAELFRFTNTGGSYITWEKIGSNAKWFFTHEDAAQGRLIIVHELNGVPDGPEFSIDPAGNLVLQGTLTQNSDRNAKQEINRTDDLHIVKELKRLPVLEWKYRHDNSGARHIGPMAQDFHGVFALGPDNRHIAPGDLAGVALSAIKGLGAMHAEQGADMKMLTSMMQMYDYELMAYDVEIEKQQERLATLEKGFGQLSQQVH